MEILLSYPSPTPFRLSPIQPKTLINPISPSPPLPTRSPLLLSSIKNNIVTTTTPHCHHSPSPAIEIEEDERSFDWFATWYPLAPVCDLDKRAPHAKTVLGLQVVLWWDRMDATWRVFDDRCPHRLAPLSEGRIDRKGRLQCVYHGWCFDGAGCCKYIPQAPPDGPQVHMSNKARAAVYPCIEQNKIVWFWPSTDPQYKNIAMKERPPYFPELDNSSYTCTMGMRDIPYGYEVLIENLMDPAHVAYAHHGIMRIPKRPPLPGRAESDREGGRPIDMTITSLNLQGYHATHHFGYSKFIAPCVHYASPDIGLSGSSLEAKRESSGDGQLKKKRALLIFLCVPVGPGRSRLLWVFPRNFAIWLDLLVPRWMFHLGQNLILDSDLYLLHLEEYKISKVGPSNWWKACYVPTKSDAQVVAFRKWLRKYCNSGIGWGSELPPSPPKEQLMDRYWSHVVNCRSCRVALRGLRALEVALQVITILSIGTLAALKQGLMTSTLRNGAVLVALACFAASKWLSHFIYKNFYFHDYNHAFR